MHYIQKPVLRMKSWVNPNFQLSPPVRAKSAQLEGMIKKVGDRELAWVMLAIAAVALWSTWGLAS